MAGNTRKFKATTPAKLSKYNEGFEKFFEAFNGAFNGAGLGARWDKEGETLRFYGYNKESLGKAMADFGFGGYADRIEEAA